MGLWIGRGFGGGGALGVDAQQGVGGLAGDVGVRGRVGESSERVHRIIVGHAADVLGAATLEAFDDGERVLTLGRFEERFEELGGQLVFIDDHGDADAGIEVLGDQVDEDRRLERGDGWWRGGVGGDRGNGDW